MTRKSCLCAAAALVLVGVLGSVFYQPLPAGAWAVSDDEAGLVQGGAYCPKWVRLNDGCVRRAKATTACPGRPIYAAAPTGPAGTLTVIANCQMGTTCLECGVHCGFYHTLGPCR